MKNNQMNQIETDALVQCAGVAALSDDEVRKLMHTTSLDENLQNTASIPASRRQSLEANEQLDCRGSKLHLCGTHSS